MELVRRLFTVPKGSFFMFGPRGTGKSTWLRQNFPDAIYLARRDSGLGPNSLLPQNSLDYSTILSIIVRA